MAVSTSWCSTVELLETALKNRVCIEQTLLQLRREKFMSESFRALDWVWNAGPWVECEHVFSVLQPFEGFIAEVEADNVSQGEAVQLFVKFREHALTCIKSLPNAAQAKLGDAVKKEGTNDL